MNSMKPKVFSENLKDLILTCGLSRWEIARRSGVSEAALSRFVNNLRGLTTDTVDRIVPVIGLKFTSVKLSAKELRRKA